MKKELEQRQIVCELTTRSEEGQQGKIFGRPIVFGQSTDIGGYFEEIIEDGALDGADLSDVRLCLNHDTGYVYARSRRNNPLSTMRLTINPGQGLDMEADLDIANSPKAKDLYSAISRNDITGMSFMFAVAEDKWERLDSDYPLRRITKIRSVVEVSAVTFPAYDQTTIYARCAETVETARKAVETARADEHRAAEAAKELELAKAKLELSILQGGKKHA